MQYARLINQTSGGTVIAPWEIEQLDPEWLDVFFGLADLPRLKNQVQKFDNRLAEIRKAHPNYRKYH